MTNKYRLTDNGTQQAATWGTSDKGNRTQLSGKYTIQLRDTHQRTRRTKGENIWIKRSPNTRDDQIQQGTHGHPLQEKPPKRGRENRTTRK